MTNPKHTSSDLVEAVAARYDFDGYGWRYIDSGSGSDWLTRHPDAELLYTVEAADRIEALEAEVERLRGALTQAAHNLARGADLYGCPGLHGAERMVRIELGGGDD